MDKDEAGSNMQRRDKDKRGLLVETLARVTYQMKAWTKAVTAGKRRK